MKDSYAYLWIATCCIGAGMMYFKLAIKEEDCTTARRLVGYSYTFIALALVNIIIFTIEGRAI